MPKVTKAGAMLVKLVSTAKTGFFYVKRRNPKKLLNKLEFRKYDPRVKKHVLFVEQKLKYGTWAMGGLLPTVPIT
jgi:large subunit ribosomal protein L33